MKNVNKECLLKYLTLSLKKNIINDDQLRSESGLTSPSKLWHVVVGEQKNVIKFIFHN